MEIDIDGVWKRIIRLDTIRISGESHVTDISEWVIGGMHRVLELRDLNSRIGCDDRAKPRHQYAPFFSQVFSRCLPPERAGEKITAPGLPLPPKAHAEFISEDCIQPPHPS